MMIDKKPLLNESYILQCQQIVNDLAKKARLRPFLIICVIALVIGFLALCGFEFYLLFETIKANAPEILPDEYGNTQTEENVGIGKYALSFMGVVGMIGFHLMVREIAKLLPNNYFEYFIVFLIFVFLMCYLIGTGGLYSNVMFSNSGWNIGDMEGGFPLIQESITWILANALRLQYIGLIGIPLVVVYINCGVLEQLKKTIDSLNEIGNEDKKAKLDMNNIERVQLEYAKLDSEKESIDEKIGLADIDAVDFINMVINEALTLPENIILERELHPHQKISEHESPFEVLFDKDDEVTRYIKSMELDALKKHYEKLRAIDVKAAIDEEL